MTDPIDFLQSESALDQVDALEKIHGLLAPWWTGTLREALDAAPADIRDEALAHLAIAHNAGILAGTDITQEEMTADLEAGRWIELGDGHYVRVPARLHALMAQLWADEDQHHRMLRGILVTAAARLDLEISGATSDAIATAIATVIEGFTDEERTRYSKSVAHLEAIEFIRDEVAHGRMIPVDDTANRFRDADPPHTPIWQEEPAP